MYGLFKTQNSMYLYTYNIKFHNVFDLGRTYLSQKSKLRHVSLSNFFFKISRDFSSSSLSVQHEWHHM